VGTERERRAEKVKYLMYWEFNPEDMDKVIKKTVEYRQLSEKNPEKYPENLYPPHSLGGQTKGIAILEGTEEQCAKLIMYYLPEEKVKLVPLFATEPLIEEYMKSKKK
jgi:hypothetical protein